MVPNHDAPERGLNVLVVEDETLVSMDLEIMLEEMGHSIAGVAPHREGAKRLIDKLGRNIDCVLLDTRLALSSSRPLAEYLKRVKIPYVVMSRRSEAELRRCGYDAPRVDKPPRPGQIRRVLEETAILT